MNITTGGQNYEIRNISAGTASDTPIDFNNKVSTFIIRCRSSVDIYLRRSNNGADYFTIPAGATLTLDVTIGNQIVGYVRSSSGTVVIECIGNY